MLADSKDDAKQPVVGGAVGEANENEWLQKNVSLNLDDGQRQEDEHASAFQECERASEKHQPKYRHQISPSMLPNSAGQTIRQMPVRDEQTAITRQSSSKPTECDATVLQSQPQPKLLPPSQPKHQQPPSSRRSSELQTGERELQHENSHQTSQQHQVKCRKFNLLGRQLFCGFNKSLSSSLSSSSSAASQPSSGGSAGRVMAEPRLSSLWRLASTRAATSGTSNSALDSGPNSCSSVPSTPVPSRQYARTNSKNKSPENSNRSIDRPRFGAGGSEEGTQGSCCLTLRNQAPGNHQQPTTTSTVKTIFKLVALKGVSLSSGQKCANSNSQSAPDCVEPTEQQMSSQCTDSSRVGLKEAAKQEDLQPTSSPLRDSSESGQQRAQKSQPNTRPELRAILSLSPGGGSRKRSTKCSTGALSSSSRQRETLHKLTGESTQQKQHLNGQTDQADMVERLISELDRLTKREEFTVIKGSSGSFCLTDQLKPLVLDDEKLEDSWTSFVLMGSASGEFVAKQQPQERPWLDLSKSEASREIQPTGSSNSKDRPSHIGARSSVESHEPPISGVNTIIISPKLHQQTGGGSCTLAPNLRVQQDAIWELLTTEASYLKGLRVATNLFMETLSKLQQRELLLEIDQTRLFNNIDEIGQTNRSLWCDCLLPMLEAARTSRRPLEPLLMGVGFAHVSHAFRPYKRYCLEHTQSLDYLKQLAKENQLFRLYLAWCECHKLCHRLRLADLLARPMQRLTRYSLLLKAIAKRTDDRRQLAALDEMVSHMDRFVLSVDLELHKRQDIDRLAAVCSRLEPLGLASADCGVHSDEIERLLLARYCAFDLTEPLFGCPHGCHRRVVFDSEQQSNQLGQIRFKDGQASGKLEVVLLLFTDLLLVCKQISSSTATTIGGLLHHHHAHQRPRWTVLQHQQRPNCESSNNNNLAFQQFEQHLGNRCPRLGSHVQQQQQHYQQHIQSQIYRRGSRKLINGLAGADGARNPSSLAPAPSLGLNGGPPMATLKALAGGWSRSHESVAQTLHNPIHWPPEVGVRSTGIFGSTETSPAHLAAAPTEVADSSTKPATTTTKTLVHLDGQPTSQSSGEGGVDTAATSATSGQTISKRRCLLTAQFHSSAGSLIGAQSGRGLQGRASSHEANSGDKGGSNNNNNSQQSSKKPTASLRVIRPTFPLDRLVMHELKDGQTIYCVQLNDSLTPASSFVLYVPGSSSGGNCQQGNCGISGAATSSSQDEGRPPNSWTELTGSRLDLAPMADTSACSSRRSSDSRKRSWTNGPTSNQTGATLSQKEVVQQQCSQQIANKLASQKVATPAGQLINLVKQAQARLRVAADFHDIQLTIFADYFGDEFGPSTNSSPNKQQQQHQPSTGGDLSTGAGCQSTSKRARKCQSIKSQFKSWSSMRRSRKGRHTEAHLATPSTHSLNPGEQVSPEGSLDRHQSIQRKSSSFADHRRSASSECQSHSGGTELSCQQPEVQQQSNSRSRGSSFASASVSAETSVNAVRFQASLARSRLEQHQAMLLAHGLYDQLRITDFRQVARSTCEPSTELGTNQQLTVNSTNELPSTLSGATSAPQVASQTTEVDSEQPLLTTSVNPNRSLDNQYDSAKLRPTFNRSICQNDAHEQVWSTTTTTRSNQVNALTSQSISKSPLTSNGPNSTSGLSKRIPARGQSHQQPMMSSGSSIRPQRISRSYRVPSGQHELFSDNELCLATRLNSGEQASIKAGESGDTSSGSSSIRSSSPHAMIVGASSASSCAYAGSAGLQASFPRPSARRKGWRLGEMRHKMSASTSNLQLLSSLGGPDEMAWPLVRVPELADPQEASSTLTTTTAETAEPEEAQSHRKSSCSSSPRPNLSSLRRQNVILSVSADHQNNNNNINNNNNNNNNNSELIADESSNNGLWDSSETTDHPRQQDRCDSYANQGSVGKLRYTSNYRGFSGDTTTTSGPSISNSRQLFGSDNEAENNNNNNNANLTSANKHRPNNTNYCRPKYINNNNNNNTSSQATTMDQSSITCEELLPELGNVWLDAGSMATGSRFCGHTLSLSLSGDRNHPDSRHQNRSASMENRPLVEVTLTVPAGSTKEQNAEITATNTQLLDLEDDDDDDDEMEPDQERFYLSIPDETDGYFESSQSELGVVLANQLTGSTTSPQWPPTPPPETFELAYGGRADLGRRAISAELASRKEPPQVELPILNVTSPTSLVQEQRLVSLVDSDLLRRAQSYPRCHQHQQHQQQQQSPTQTPTDEPDVSMITQLEIAVGGGASHEAPLSRGRPQEPPPLQSQLGKSPEVLDFGSSSCRPTRVASADEQRQWRCLYHTSTGLTNNNNNNDNSRNGNHLARRRHLLDLEHLEHRSEPTTSCLDTSDEPNSWANNSHSARCNQDNCQHPTETNVVAGKGGAPTSFRSRLRLARSEASECERRGYPAGYMGLEGALLDIDCIKTLVKGEDDQEPEVGSAPQSEIASDDAGRRRRWSRSSIGYLGFHEKLELYNKRLTGGQQMSADHLGRRDLSGRERVTSDSTDGCSSSGDLGRVVGAPSIGCARSTETTTFRSLPTIHGRRRLSGDCSLGTRQKSKSRIRAALFSSSRSAARHLSTSPSEGPKSTPTGSRPQKAFSLTRSITGELFDSLLRVASLRTMSGCQVARHHNNNNRSKTGERSANILDGCHKV